MTIHLIAALLLQGFSVFLLRRTLGKHWLNRPFVLMVLAAVLYHGLSEILMLVPEVRGGNRYRFMLTQAQVHYGALLVSAGILAATCAYLLALGPGRRDAVTDLSVARSAMQRLDWRVLSVLLLPIAAVTYSGQGYSSGEVLDARAQSSLTVVAMAFFLILVTLTAFSVVWRFGMGALVPTIGASSLLLAAAGQRLEILVSAMTVCVMLTVVGHRLTVRHLLALGAISAVCVLAITSARASQGRDVFHSHSGFSMRLDAVTSSILERPGSTTRSDPSLLAQFAARFDSNEWAGGVAQSMSQGVEPMGLQPIAQTFEVVIPSAFYATKNDGDITERSSEAAQIVHFRLLDTDHIPSHFGLWLGLAGVPLYFPVIALFGWLFAKLERWTLARVTTNRLIVLCLLLIGSLFVERGIHFLAVTLRYAIPIVIASTIARLLIDQTKGRTHNASVQIGPIGWTSRRAR